MGLYPSKFNSDPSLNKKKGEKKMACKAKTTKKKTSKKCGK